MADKETVIGEFERWCDEMADECPVICLHVLALLKEQEAVGPIRIDGKHNHFIKCGNCNNDLMTGYQFCPHCGRQVKWK